MNRWKVSISNKHLRWTVKTASGIKDLDSETELTVDSLYNVSVMYDGSDMEVFLNGISMLCPVERCDPTDID